MAQVATDNLSPITFAIKNLWQLKESYTMNLILFQDEEIQCEIDDIPSSSKQKDDDNIMNGNKLRVIHLNQNDYRCKHIETVLKSKSGDTVRIGIINGKQGFAKIVWSKDINNNNNNNPYLRLEIIESSMKFVIDKISESITLVLALPRPKVLNRLYPIISSLGIKEIILINAERVEKSYFNSKYLEENRFTKGLIAGMVQCRDTKLPKIMIEKNLNNFICNKLETMYPSNQSIRIIAHPGEHLPRINELKCFNLLNENKDNNDNDDKLEMSLDEQRHQNIVNQEMKQDDDNNDNDVNKKQFILLIGPEGGWIDDEISMFEKNDFNVCSIGMRILRTDVACISLLSILRSHIEQYLQLR